MRYFEKQSGKRWDRTKYIGKNIWSTELEQIPNLIRKSKNLNKSKPIPISGASVSENLMNLSTPTVSGNLLGMSNPTVSKPITDLKTTKVVKDTSKVVADVVKEQPAVSNTVSSTLSGKGVTTEAFKNAKKFRAGMLRGGIIGVGTGLGAAGGTLFNSEGSLTGTLIGAGAGGIGTAIATGGTNNKILSRGVQLLRKLRGK